MINMIGTAWNIMDQNVLQGDNILWILMGFDKSDWEKKYLNIFQREGINLECDKRQWIWSGCKQTECIEMCQYDMVWDGNGIDFFNANYQRYLSSIGSVGNCLPRAWRGHWRTDKLTRRCSCTVICRICITELLINTIVFFYDNNSRYEVMG